MKNIKAKWAALPGKKKQMVIAGTIIGVVAVGAIIADSGDDTNIRRQLGEDKQVSVFSTNNAREAGIEGVSSQTRQNLRKLSQLEDELNRYKQQNESLIESVQKQADPQAFSTAIGDLRSELSELRKDNENLRSQLDMTKDNLAKGRSGSSSGDGATAGGEDDHNFKGWSPRGQDDAPPRNEYEVPLNPMATLGSQGATPDGVNVMEQSGEDFSEPEPRRIMTKVENSAEKSSDKEDEAAGSQFIPAGSILTGVLVTGLDAPTGSGSRRDPYPALVRLNTEAILPNRFRSDVRECFMLVSGTGELSSERAYLRSETLSCVREDGGVIETGMRGYVAGEDGKAGIHGTLVSKQGQLLAKSMMAGFMSGVSEAFDVDPVPVLSTSSTGTTQYDRNYSPEVVQGATVAGASSALERIAEFYTDMAEEMFPVIEIQAGRKINIILTSGVKLKIQE